MPSSRNNNITRENGVAKWRERTQVVMYLPGVKFGARALTARTIHNARGERDVRATETGVKPIALAIEATCAAGDDGGVDGGDTTTTTTTICSDLLFFPLAVLFLRRSRGDESEIDSPRVFENHFAGEDDGGGGCRSARARVVTRQTTEQKILYHFANSDPAEIVEILMN